MFHARTNYSVMPRTIGGLIEDVFQNGWKLIQEDTSSGNVHPPVNIQELEKSYELHLFAPGLRKDDFKISVDRNVLNIVFDQKEETAEEKAEQPAGKWIRKEFRVSSFKRAFTLNDKINANGINAKYNDGILTVTLPKKENIEPTPKEIKID